jgi:hypothetical protein
MRTGMLYKVHEKDMLCLPLVFLLSYAETTEQHVLLLGPAVLAWCKREVLWKQWDHFQSHSLDAELALQHTLHLHMGPCT